MAGKDTTKEAELKQKQKEAELKQKQKEVNERRLKLVYDYIDNDDPKGGLREAEHAIKKFPNLTAAKCLKALCLLRMNRDSDAFVILDACDVDGQHHDDLAIQAFIHCYKEASTPIRITHLYERILAVDRNEQNLVSYFMAFVRVKEFEKMQAVAQMLHKEHPRGNYWQYIVTTFVLKARFTNPANALFNWTMADKMMIFATNGIPYTSPQVELHSMIKEGLGEYLQAAELLETHRGILMTPPIFVEQRYIELLYKGDEYAKVIERCEPRLAANNDDWKSWMYFFDATFDLYAKTEEEEKKKELLDKAVMTVLDNCKEEEGNRGPFMARFELMTRYRKAELPIDERLGEPLEHLKGYVMKFFEKPCCYVDIERYTPLLGASPIPLYAGLRDWVQEKVAESKYRAIIIFEKLRVHMGVGLLLSAENRRGNVDMLITALGDITDDHLGGGEISYLAGNMLSMSYANDLDPLTAMEMLCILENGAAMFSTNYLSKVALCRIYGELNAVRRISQLFESLDVKSVQRETLGQLLYPMYEVCGMFRTLPATFVQVTGLYNQAEREIAECMIGAFKNTTFTQLPGLMDLDQKLEKSALAAFSDVMHRYISAIFILSDDAALDVLYGEDVDWENLVDNRDSDLLPNFENPQGKQAIEKHKMHSHREMVNITKLRHLLCRAVFTVGKMENSEKKQDKCDAAMMLEAINLLKTHLMFCKTYYLNLVINQIYRFYARFLQTACPLHLPEWIYSQCFAPIIGLLDAAHAIVAAKEVGKDVAEMDASILPEAENLYLFLAANIPLVDKPVLHMRVWIHLFSRACQSLATCKLILSFISRRLGVTAAPAAAPVSKNKKKNKAKAQAQEPPKPKPVILTRIEQLNEAIRKAAAQYVGVIDGMKDLIENPEYGLFPPEEDDLYDERVRSVLEAFRPQVKEHLLDSYRDSMDEMVATLDRFCEGLKASDLPPLPNLASLSLADAAPQSSKS